MDKLDISYEEKLVQNGIGIKTTTYFKVMMLYPYYEDYIAYFGVN